MKRKWIIAVIVLVGGIQFVRIDKTQPAVVEKENFVAMHNVDQEVKSILEKACYDCHSYEVNYPWYSNIAPISWWVGHHIDEGREHLNFSIWGTYSEERQAHKLEECAEEVEEHKMPMQSYTWMHGEAELSQEEIDKLVSFFESI